METVTEIQTIIKGTPRELAKELAAVMKEFHGVEEAVPVLGEPVIVSGFMVAHKLRKVAKDKKKGRMNNNKLGFSFESGNSPYIYFPDLMDITTAAFYMGVEEATLKKWIYVHKYLEPIYIDSTVRMEKVKLDALRFNKSQANKTKSELSLNGPSFQ